MQIGKFLICAVHRILFFPHGSTALVGQTSLLKFRIHTQTHHTW